MGRLFLLFTVVPAIELFLLLQLGAWMGPLPTLLLILTTGLLGASLARQEGLSVLFQLSQEAQRGLPPGDRLAEGALIVAGGLLLVTPGVLTDLTGFLLIFGPTRRRIAPALVRAVASRVTVQTMGMPGAPPPRYDGPPSSPPPKGGSPFDHPVA